MHSSQINCEISVLITCHNEDKYIETCIRSVLDQTIFNLIEEIIVINDSSTDNSFKILKNLSNECHRLKIIQADFGSLSKARNLGIKLSKGKYIAILDGDDFWSKTKLENQLEKIKDIAEDYGLLYTNYIDFDDNKLDEGKKISVRSFNKISNNQLIKYFCKDGPIVPSTIFIKSDVVKNIGKFDKNLKYYEDTDFYLRLLEKYKIFHLQDYSCYKRRHPNQITNKLYELIPFGDQVIHKSALRNKNLNKFKKIRYARNRNKAALQAITIYNYKFIALKLIIQSIKFNPSNLLAWMILILLLFPRTLIFFKIKKIKKFKKK